MEFMIDERLAGDTIEVCMLELSCVGLMNDSRYPWLIIVPRKPNLTEIVELDDEARALLWREVDYCSSVMQKLYPGAKLNIGALGNIVRQLHIHVIARHEGDAAWPGPVWGVGAAVPYKDEQKTQLLAKLKEAFQPLPR